jgi:hypothetical protein
MNGDPHRRRSGVKFRRGQPLGRARSSGGFARRANFNDREAARSSCEPSRGLDAVERRWSRSGVRDVCTQGYMAIALLQGLTSLITQANGPTSCVGRISGSRWGSGWGAVPAVPANGRSPAFHHHDGQFFGHGFSVVVLRTRGPLLGRGQVPENRRGQAIEVDPGGHMTRSGMRHDRTPPAAGVLILATRSL